MDAYINSQALETRTQSKFLYEEEHDESQNEEEEEDRLAESPHPDLSSCHVDVLASRLVRLGVEQRLHSPFRPLHCKRRR